MYDRSYQQFWKPSWRGGKRVRNNSVFMKHCVKIPQENLHLQPTSAANQRILLTNFEDPTCTRICPAKFYISLTFVCNSFPTKTCLTERKFQEIVRQNFQLSMETLLIRARLPTYQGGFQNRDEAYFPYT